MALALIRTLRYAIANIPFGGSNGGICIDPDKFSRTELERIMKRYTIELANKRLIGSSTDLLGPD